MVNRAAVLLVGGLVLVAVVVIGGVAALVLGSGGPAGSGTPTAFDATPLPSPTPVPGDGTPSTPTRTRTAAGTATLTGTVTATSTPRPTVLPGEFDSDRIETLVARAVNERRVAAGLEPLALNGTTVDRLTVMAREHSDAMAARGEAVHVIDGNTSTDRYHEHELYTTCRWTKPGEEAIAASDASGITDSPNGFEAVADTVAGREYVVDGETRFNADEADVARAVVATWWNTTVPPYPERLTLPNARYLGVGVEVTQFGEVYVTANLC